MKILKNLLSSSKTKSENKSSLFWTDINDVKVKTWRLFHETRDLRYFQREYDEKSELTQEHLDAWFTLSDQLHQARGGQHSRDYLKYLECKRRYALMMAEYLATGKRFNINKANIAKIDMEAALEDSTSHDFKQGIISIKQYMGYSKGLNEHELSVPEYFDYLDSIAASYGKAS